MGQAKLLNIAYQILINLFILFFGHVAASAAENLELRGEVVSVSAEKRLLLLKHEGAHGALTAGETEFAIGKGDSLILKPGTRIRGNVIRGGETLRLETIWPAGEFAERVVNNLNRLLREDTLSRDPAPFRHIGDVIPEFALYNQDGDVVLSRSLRGKKVVLNFIYTRCPMPMMCPAAIQHMQRLQQKARRANIKNLQLISITFDPVYDSPGILKAYMIDRGIDESNFMLLSGDPGAVKDLLLQFGVAARKDIHTNTYDHSMATILIDETGTIAFRKDGMKWSEDDFLKQL